MTVEETIGSNADHVTMATRIRLGLGEYDEAKVAAIRANQSLAEWFGAAVREKLDRDGTQP